MRLNALAVIFAKKSYFSRLLDTLAGAVPEDMAITEITVPSEQVVSISGTSRGYVSLKNFLLNLRDTGATSVGFEAVDLRSVSLDQQTGEQTFNLNLTVVKGGLRK